MNRTFSEIGTRVDQKPSTADQLVMRLRQSVQYEMTSYVNSIGKFKNFKLKFKNFTQTKSCIGENID